jgi:hypothetical protein
MVVVNPDQAPADHDPNSFYRTTEPRPDWTVWREGDQIVFTNGVAFPMCCVKCGAPAQRAIRTNLMWHNPWLYVLAIFPGVLIYAIVATIVSQRATVDVPVCEHHRVRRLQAMAAAGLILLASVVGPIAYMASVSASDGDPVGVACAIVPLGGLVALIVAIVGARLVVPSFIDKSVVKLKGAGAGFLAKCPPMQ